MVEDIPRLILAICVFVEDVIMLPSTIDRA